MDKTNTGGNDTKKENKKINYLEIAVLITVICSIFLIGKRTEYPDASYPVIGLIIMWYIFIYPAVQPDSAPRKDSQRPKK